MIVRCESCDANVSVKEVGGYTYQESQQAPPLEVSLTNCPECHRPILVGRERFGGDFLDDPFVMYPRPRKGLSTSVPETVRRAFGEALSCASCRAFSATVLMCRKALEALCADNSVVENNLAASLSRLKSDGVIDERLFSWADALRLAGNAAAHDVDLDVDPQHARDVLDLTEAIADYVYVYQAQYEAFIDRSQEDSQ